MGGFPLLLFYCFFCLFFFALFYILHPNRFYSKVTLLLKLQYCISKRSKQLPQEIAQTLKLARQQRTYFYLPTNAKFTVPVISTTSTWTPHNISFIIEIIYHIKSFMSLFIHVITVRSCLLQARTHAHNVPFCLLPVDQVCAGPGEF